MARQPRIALVGRPHLLLQSTTGDAVAFVDDDDRRACLAAVHDCARSTGVVLHAYALASRRIQLLATPGTADALARFMQRLGRRHALAFNRRHGHAGRLWHSRFGSAAVLSEHSLLDVLLSTEQLPVREGCAASAGEWPWSSAPHHLGHRPDSRIRDLGCYWSLGNTPFERQARHARLLQTPLPEARVAGLEAAARAGWPIGSAADVAQAQLAAPQLALRPAPRGRPRKGLEPVPNK